jgi:hypothetical protein
MVSFPFVFCVNEAFRSWLTLRKEAQVELLGKTPNGLSASSSLPAAEMQCQYKQEPLSEKEELMLKAQCRVLKITQDCRKRQASNQAQGSEVLNFERCPKGV